MISVRPEEPAIHRDVMVEIHSNISAANVYVSSPLYFAQVRVEIQEDNIVVTFDPHRHRRRTINIFTTTDLFIPPSFHKLSGHLSSVSKNEVGVVTATFFPKYMDFGGGHPSCIYVASFRLEIKSSVVSSISKYISTAKDLVIPAVRPDESYWVYCRCCHSKLTDKEVIFTRVSDLDLNLLETAENFYCHSRHKTDIMQHVNTLFMNNSTYSLKCLDEKHIEKDETKSMVECKECLSVLSMVKHQFDSKAILCFKDKIEFQRRGEGKSSLSAVEVSMALILDIIENTLATAVTCKLYLESKKVPSSENNCLLLWVMDHDHKKFKIAENKADSEEKLEFQRVMKILFHKTKPNADVARSWIEEFSVDHHHVSNTMLDDIFGTLEASSEKMIEYEQNFPLKLFSVGYMPVRKKLM